MAVRITISKSACFLFGAALGVAIALVVPSYVNADDKEKGKNKKQKNAATNTSKINEDKQRKLYGDETMSDILGKAKLGVQKVWPKKWTVVLMNSRHSSTISSDVFHDAQTSFPKSSSQREENVDSVPDTYDTASISTIYTPVGKLSLAEKMREVARGFKRANTSKNDCICTNFPPESTVIESENNDIIEENKPDDSTETTARSNSISGNDKNKKLVLSLKTPFSPVIKVFQACKRFRAKKRDKMKNSDNAENIEDNGIQVIADG